MQREEVDETVEGGILVVISCDFCRRDWDGQEPMIEGHHGSVICPGCLDLALAGAQTSAEGLKYQCNLCLRFNIPATVAKWSHPGNPEAVVCGECLQQAAGVLGKTLRKRQEQS